MYLLLSATKKKTQRKENHMYSDTRKVPNSARSVNLLFFITRMCQSQAKYFRSKTVVPHTNERKKYYTGSDLENISGDKE